MEFICSICGKTFVGYGNNPYPVTKGKDDRCCDACNAEFVVPARIAHLYGGDINEEDDDYED